METLPYPDGVVRTYLPSGMRRRLDRPQPFQPRTSCRLPLFPNSGWIGGPLMRATRLFRRLLGWCTGETASPRTRSRRPVRRCSGPLLLEQLEDRLVPSALAAIHTDLADYAPGATAQISGDHFDPNESVTLQ